MFNAPLRIDRVAPGTAYTTGNDVGAGPYTLGVDGTIRVTVAISAAAKLLLRTSSQNLAFNNDANLGAATMYSFEFGASVADAFSFRFDGNVTIRYFLVQLFKQR